MSPCVQRGSNFPSAPSALGSLSSGPNERRRERDRWKVQGLQEPKTQMEPDGQTVCVSKQGSPFHERSPSLPPNRGPFTRHQTIFAPGRPALAYSPVWTCSILKLNRDFSAHTSDHASPRSCGKDKGVQPRVRKKKSSAFKL